MRWQELIRSPSGSALSLILCLVLAACATPDGGEPRGPLGGTGSPLPPAKVGPPVPGEDAARVQPDPGQLPGLDRRDNVYFSQGSSSIDEVGRETIRRHAEKLKGNRRLVVTLIGHSTDGGSMEYKVALGQKRVDAVAEELRSAGAAQGQIRKQSVPSGKSAGDRCASEACYQLDRRVELRYIDLKTPPSRRVP
jgi:outer membrane protein OmpA-like peptidoglycan-associated protein